MNLYSISGSLLRSSASYLSCDYPPANPYTLPFISSYSCFNGFYWAYNISIFLCITSSLSSNNFLRRFIVNPSSFSLYSYSFTNSRPSFWLIMKLVGSISNELTLSKRGGAGYASSSYAS